MRHSTINLTMGTYWHLLPDAEAEAADRLGHMFLPQDPNLHSAPTTSPGGPKSRIRAQRQAQQAGRDWQQSGARPCDEPVDPAANQQSSERRDFPASTRQFANLNDPVRERRARDSNPQPVSRHLISSQAASHSLTLRRLFLTSYGNGFCVGFNVN